MNSRTISRDATLLRVIGGVDDFEWSFPGGNPSSSYEENPEVIYEGVGTYSVSLTITGGVDGSLTDVKVMDDYIMVYEPTSADDYCDATHVDDYLWVSRVVLNDIDNQTTGWPDNGYSDFAPTHITELEAGSEYDLSVELNYTNIPNINIGVWLDHQQNASFMNEGDELLIAHPPQLGQLTDATITIPTEAVNGVTRLRIRANYQPDQIVLPCGHDDTYLGEIEDYSKLITGGIWKITSATYPEDYGSVSGTGTFNDGDQVTLTALADPGYHFVHWTENREVIIGKGEPVGDIYMFIAKQHRDLTAHFAINTYTLSFQVVDSISDEEIDDAIITLNGDQYDAEIYVFKELPPDMYAYIVNHDLYKEATGELEIENEDVDIVIELQEDDTFVEEIERLEVTAFPNPAQSTLYVEANMNMLELQLIDMLGQVVLSETTQDVYHELSLSGLQDGMYFLQITTESGIKTLRLRSLNIFAPRQKRCLVKFLAAILSNFRTKSLSQSIWWPKKV